MFPDGNELSCLLYRDAKFLKALRVVVQTLGAFQGGEAGAHRNGSKVSGDSLKITDSAFVHLIFVHDFLLSRNGC